MTKASDNAFPSILITEGTEPSAPAAGKQRLYIDSTTHKLKRTDSSGTDVTIEGASGAITSSGLTMATARLLGRTTASTGAVEEITVGTGLSLSAGSLTATGGGSGALALLEQYTASSSASLDFTTAITSTYDDYMIELLNVVPASNNVTLYCKLSSDGGSTWNASSNYYSACVYVTNSGTSGGTNFGGANPSTLFMVADGLSTSASRGVSGSLHLYSPLSTASDKSILGPITWTNQTALVSGTWTGLLTVGGTAFNAVRFIMSSGNIASGTIRMYGVAKT